MFRQLLLTIITAFIFTANSYAEKLIVEPEMGRAPILSALKNAKSSVDMVMYGFTDEELMNAFVNTEKSGKSVHVLLEKKPYKNESENTNAERTLKSGNINLQWANPLFKLTHQKTIITDHKTAFVMTFNLTHSTFKNERNFALIIDDPSMVDEIENVFHADATHSTAVMKNPNLVWSPNSSRDKLLNFIHTAKSSIQIYAQDISDYKTIGALADAARHGITVDVLTSSKTSDRNRNKYNYLTGAGVRMHLSTKLYIHAKVIIIDHKHALLGSMNLTKASIDKNRELSVITHNGDIIQTLENTFSYDCGKKTTLGSKVRWWLQTLNHHSRMGRSDIFSFQRKREYHERREALRERHFHGDNV